MQRERFEALLPTLLEELRDSLQKKIYPRDVVVPDTPNKILVAMGMRRVGKTFFLYQQIQKLLAEKIPYERILYINFEDDRLLPMDQKGFAGLIESFYTRYPENHDHLCYFFFDEIQNVEGWSTVIRRFFDTKKIRIFLSGSSAKLLSKDIASALRGRSLAIEMWPYSFREYLRAHAIDWPPYPAGKKVKDQTRKSFNDYLHIGGFPEIQTLDAENRIRILQDYVNLVVLRDIVERYDLTNIALIRSLIKTLVGTVGHLFSVNKTFNDLKSLGLRVSKNTLYDYLAHIEDAYLFFPVPLFSPSIRKQQTNPRKIYGVDPGLVQAERLVAHENWGMVFENLVYLDVRRKGYKIFYYLTKERYEVDFVIQDLQGKIRLFQVSWQTTDKKTLEREQRALEVAERELGVRGELVTPDNYLKFLKEL